MEAKFSKMTQERVSNSFSDYKPTIPLWTSDEIQHATHGKVLSAFNATNVVIDSREIKGGDLFVALKGPQFEGHDYVKKALESGATGALVTHMPEGVPQDAPLVIVPDVLEALNALARAARERSRADIIGITGSFGKTSMKEALRHVLEQEGYTLATERSFNNHWGLPLTLSRLHPEHEYAVIEMGMNNPGEISRYSHLVKPHIALITNTGDAHIGKMGSLKSIAKAKAEIFEGLVTKGKAILWSEDEAFEAHCADLNAQKISYVTFGRQADFEAQSEMTFDGLRISIGHNDEQESFVLPTFSEHWERNCAAITAMLDVLGIDWQRITLAMKNFTFPQGRGNIIKTKAGLTILDESYNAAPTTMHYALKSLEAVGKITHKRTIAILGDMLELGEESPQYHKDLVTAFGFKNISKVYGCGPEMKHLYDVVPESQKGAWAKDPQDLIPFVLADANVGDIYLIKGSRGQWAARGRMSAFVDALEQCTPENHSQKKEAL